MRVLNTETQNCPLKHYDVEYFFKVVTWTCVSQPRVNVQDTHFTLSERVISGVLLGQAGSGQRVYRMTRFV